MNRKAEELGLLHTHFTSPHGLDNPMHYTTAYELAIITDYALNIEKIAKVVNTKNYTVNINGYSKVITNTHELLGYLDGVNGVKTGFTNDAGRCLVTSVNRNGFNIIVVVLGANTKKIRTKDSIKIINYIYENYELVNLEEKILESYEKWKQINEKRIVINNKKSRMGFPSRIQDAPILNLLLDNCDSYPYAEERRLFYVALTRAKKKVFLVTVKGQESVFARELRKRYGESLKKEQFECPLCGGHLVKRSGSFGEFFGCSNYHKNGCSYKRKIQQNTAKDS